MTSPVAQPDLGRPARPPGPGGARLSSFLRLLRPSDWTKNVLVLAPLVFASRLGDAGSDIRAAVAFLAFVCLSSGFYCVNDALDSAEDRLHPVKRRRPVAAGEISPGVAVALGVALIAAGLGIGLALGRVAGAAGGLYVLLQIAYNARLKRVMMVDVTAVACGFVLRTAFGAAAIRVQLSIWLALCVFFLTLYLGFIKRLCDLSSAEAAGTDGAGADAVRESAGAWRSAAGYDSRAELNWLLAVSGVLAVMTYLMYTLSEHTSELFGGGSIGFALLTPLVVIAIHRFFRRASSGLSDRPMDAIVRDRAVRACVVLFAAGVLLSIYNPHLRDWLGRVFMK